MLTIPLTVLAVHFVADFVLQNDWMAKNKSRENLPLLTHTVIYSLCFLGLGFPFVFFTFVTHTITDLITSRINRHFWEQGESHWFFVGIGADQLIHYWTLAWTIRLLTS